MRADRKQIILVSVAIIIALGCFGFYVQLNIRHSANQLAGQQSHEVQEVTRLEADILKLRQLQQELSNAGFVTNDALTKERKNAQRIQQKLTSVISQNKSLLDKINKVLMDKQELSRAKEELDKNLEVLSVQNGGLQKEVELLRKNFDVALQVRVRLARVQESIEGLIVQKGKENILEMQMEALIREVEEINQYLLEVRDNRIAPKLVMPATPAQSESAGVRKGKSDMAAEIRYLEQVNDLKARINILTSENAVLKEKYLMAQGMSEQNKKVLDSGSQKIFALQARLIDAESAASQSKTHYQDLERSVASLRERYVANELEKEGLKIKLNQLTAELNDVRSKFLALLGKITDIFQSSGSELSSSQRYNLTSIIGVELFPNTTDTGQ